MTGPGAGVLVVGYGNPLRGDDGVGWHAARRLAADPRLKAATVLARHQLVPELAADVGRASLVVLVDAATEGAPGSLSVRPIRPRPATPPTWSHHLGPEALAGLAEALYGPAPPIVLVSVAAGSFAEGDGLSGALRQVLPEVVELVAGVVTGQHQQYQRSALPDTGTGGGGADDRRNGEAGKLAAGRGYHPPAIPRIIPDGNLGDHPTGLPSLPLNRFE